MGLSDTIKVTRNKINPFDRGTVHESLPCQFASLIILLSDVILLAQVMQLAWRVLTLVTFAC